MENEMRYISPSIEVIPFGELGMDTGDVLDNSIPKNENEMNDYPLG
ncbi:MAG: hypothetical protein IKR73_08440 [Oscillospiraceae bacterium]|nr:hypothetical protein [Oscillospiraceae bacterium]